MAEYHYGFTDLVTLLQQRYGLLVSEQSMERLTDVVLQCQQKFGHHSLAALFAAITTKEQSAELHEIVNNYTVDESYFFRAEDQMRFLQYEYLPKLIAQRRQENKKMLRIWSAGCSTGQEIYSVAIMLQQLLPDIAEWNIHLIGSDISHTALSAAVEAKYSNWNIRQSSLLQQAHLFHPSGNSFQLNATYKSMVQFFYLNLAEDTYPSIINGTSMMDVILCRNVFIYFTAAALEETTRRFTAALTDGGIVMTAAADPILQENALLQRQERGEVFYYQKIAELPAAVSLPRTEWKMSGVPLTVATEEPADAVDIEHTDVTPQQLIALIREERWQEVIALCRSISSSQRSSDIYQFEGKALANIGEFARAEVALLKAIELNRLDPHNHLLLGLVLLQLGQVFAAEKSFRNTIFLNNDFMEAHYHLAQIMMGRGDLLQAMRYLKNAVALARADNRDRKVHNSLSITYAGFADIINNEIGVLARRMMH